MQKRGLFNNNTALDLFINDLSQVVLLKSLWDMISLVKTSIDDWKKTRWQNIDVEQMELDCRKFAKDIRSLDKEVFINVVF